MKKDDFLKQVHIGRLIQAKAAELGISEKKFADILFFERSNIRDIYDRQSINIELLVRISIALKYDFFTEIYGKHLPFKKEPDSLIITIEKSRHKIRITKQDGGTSVTEYVKIEEI
jgi:hypothetical protein